MQSRSLEEYSVAIEPHIVERSEQPTLKVSVMSHQSQNVVALHRGLKPLPHGTCSACKTNIKDRTYTGQSSICGVVSIETNSPPTKPYIEA